MARRNAKLHLAVDTATHAIVAAEVSLETVGDNEALTAGELAEWERQSGYYQQSKAETSMYRYKQLISLKLSQRNHNALVGEILAGIKALNKVIGLRMPIWQPLN